MFEELCNIIKSRRSIRSFKNEKIDIDLVKEIIDISSHAPSNNNRQGWKFYIVNSENIIQEIYQCVLEKLNLLLNKSQVFDELFESYKNNFLIFKNAPVIIICCFVKPNLYNSKFFQINDDNSHMSGELISSSLVMQNIMLSAEANNIGSLIMTAPLIASKEIKNILKIPNKYSIGSFICLGKYDKKPDPPIHKPLDNIIEII